MRNKILYATFLLCIIITNPCIAQFDLQPKLLSPEAATLGKFGAYPVSYYTGVPNISVPLYTLKTNQVEVPIDITYDASGVLVNSEPGLVGQNWHLNAGGAITREVNGIPDEQSHGESSAISDIMKYGYWYGINNIAGSPKSGDYLKNLSYYDSSSLIAHPKLPYEHTPDLFTFNFCGHKGRFLIGNDGQVKVISDRPYKVDLSKLSSYDPREVFNETSEITIIADDGVKFTFGGQFNALEISVNSNGPQININNKGEKVICPRPAYTGVINSWYLTKITCPNTETVDFVYEEQDPLSLKKLDSSYRLDYDYLRKIYWYKFTHQHDACGNGVNAANLINDRGIFLRFIKTTYLKQIKTSDGSYINFNCTEKDVPFYGNNRVYYSPTQQYLYPHNQLKVDSINIFNSLRQPVKKVSFSYFNQIAADYYDGNYSANCYRDFLIGVTANDNENYTFDYHNKNLLPQPLSLSIDLWGYFNGNSNAYFPPVGNAGPFDVDLSARKANPACSKYGLLSKITYPTGGYTTFNYESNEYGTVLRQTKTSDLSPVIMSENGYAGGARLLETVDSPGNGQPDITRHFYYKENYSPNDATSTSSGILVDYNVNLLLFKYRGEECDRTYYLLSGDNINSAISIQESPIGYAEVTETTSKGGYTKYYYSNHITNPDKYNLGAGTYKISLTGSLTSDLDAQFKRLFKYSSCELERGQLKEQITCNESGKMVKDEFYHYNEDANRYNDAMITYDTPFWHQGRGIFHSYAIYYFQNKVTSKTTTVFDGNNGISTTEYNTYSNKLLSSKAITNSNGITQKTKYKYPSDFQESPYPAMVAKNILSPIVETTIFRNTTLVEKIQNGYALFKNLFYAPAYLKHQYGSGSLETRKTYSYDLKSNLQEEINNDYFSTVYLWGYGYLYPIVKIENSSYYVIENALGASTISNLAAGYPTEAQVNAVGEQLRNKFPSALVTSYTYCPLVGMTSATAPNGVTTYYEYDTFNRLKRTYIIENGEQKTVKSYDYHYQGQ